MEHEQHQTPAARVACHTGYRTEEYPQHFYIGQRRIEVDEIIDRWLDPNYSYFKLRGDDGGIYILQYQPASDCWKLIMYDSGANETTRLSSS